MEQKEGIDMDEKKTDPSGYEPNFVMKDAAEPEAAENQPNMAENQPDMPEDPENLLAEIAEKYWRLRRRATRKISHRKRLLTHQMILRKKEHSAIRGRLFATQNPARALISIMSTIVPVR